MTNKQSQEWITKTDNFLLKYLRAMEAGDPRKMEDVRAEYDKDLQSQIQQAEERVKASVASAALKEAYNLGRIEAVDACVEEILSQMSIYDEGTHAVSHGVARALGRIAENLKSKLTPSTSPALGDAGIKT